MNIRITILTVLLLASGVTTLRAADDYKSSKEYLTLRDSMHHAFNDADSARFYPAVHALQNYLLAQGDQHAYYTQRCNEVIFELNHMNIFEAYRLGKQLSRELTEKKLDKEMYMAVNMMGHIYNYSGNKEAAKQCFWDVIHRMEKEGYRESMPPIYMNLVNITMNEDPREAMKLIDKALELAGESSPDRVFDIETRRTLGYLALGDTANFVKGYKAYKEGVAKGFNSVHGRQLEIQWLASQGQADEAVKLATDAIDNPYETQAEVYAQAGRWKEAFDALKKGTEQSDSINSFILKSSMEGIESELQMYEVRRQQSRVMFYSMVIVISLLLLLVAALVYIVQSRRRHWRQMESAYQHVIEAEKVKTDFIQNVSHEVRTPLNVITGFAQVMANPENNLTQEERRSMADMMVHNTYRITNMINEVLMIAVHESATERRLTAIHCNAFFSDIVANVHVEMEKKKLLKLSYDSVLDDGFTIQSEERLLKLILVQLLDNAVKNTSVGTITLKASATDTELILAVEDTGCGVPPHEEERIFERFVKLDQFKEGLGIGLTFSRTMAQRLGGDVRLDTTYQGPGARFVVTIPLA